MTNLVPFFSYILRGLIQVLLDRMLTLNPRRFRLSPVNFSINIMF